MFVMIFDGTFFNFDSMGNGAPPQGRMQNYTKSSIHCIQEGCEFTPHPGRAVNVRWQ